MIPGTYFPPLRITHIDELISKLSRPCRVRRPDSASTSSLTEYFPFRAATRVAQNVSIVNDNVLYHSLHWIAHFDALGCRCCFDYLGSVTMA
jgi:hypothetical protein